MLVLQSLVFGLFTVIGAFYAAFLWRRRRLYYLAAQMPGPKGLPLIGMGHKFFTSDFKQIFDFLMTIPDGYKAPMKIWIGPELVVFANTPEILQVVLNSQNCLHKSMLYDVLIVRKGLLVASGDLWRRHRKLLNPAFSIGILQNLVPTFDKKSTIFVKNLESEVGKKEFDVYGYMSACSLETLLSGTMETDRDIQSNPLNSKYIHDIEECAKLMMCKMLNFLYRIEPLYRFTNLYKLEQKHAHNGVLKIAEEILDEKCQEEAELGEALSENDHDGLKRKPKSFIRTLIDPRNDFSDQEMKDEINTLIAAGHETSALVISEAILMLAMFPEVQQKVVDEIKEVFGTADAPIDYDSLKQLTYLDYVVKETMRLFPVLPVSARETTDEVEVSGKIIPKGATVMISAFSVQRNKEFWGPDADTFRPERFEPENFSKIPSYAYIPFTGGPRICIGWRYGMLFMKSCLVNFLRNYEATTSLKFEELDYEITLSMKIVQRCMVSVKKRNF